MKKIIALIAIVGFTASCVNSNVAVAYAKRAHSECSNFTVEAHSYGGENESSLTEVSMKCGEVRKSISVKCRFGLGIISDTTCHENN